MPRVDAVTSWKILAAVVARDSPVKASDPPAMRRQNFDQPSFRCRGARPVAVGSLSNKGGGLRFLCVKGSGRLLQVLDFKFGGMQFCEWSEVGGDCFDGGHDGF